MASTPDGVCPCMLTSHLQRSRGRDLTARTGVRRKGVPPKKGHLFSGRISKMLIDMNSPTETDPRWQAVRERDASRDGSFVYAVRTTGVYCRPACPSRLAKPANVEFFDDPA